MNQSEDAQYLYVTNSIFYFFVFYFFFSFFFNSKDSAESIFSSATCW